MLFLIVKLVFYILFLSPLVQQTLFGMQLHTGTEQFGNVIFRYSELPSKYHLDASIDVYHTCRACVKTIVSQSGTVTVRKKF